nr:hypothetical protein [uncultured Psychroserpens sp.]
MSPIAIIVTSFIIMSVFALLFQYYVWKSSKVDKIIIEEHWQKFLKADSQNDIEGIKTYADKLVWNKHIETEQLNKIMEAINSRVEKYPEFEKLSNVIFNKNRHLDRPLHYSGSSGGKKQSW